MRAYLTGASGFVGGWLQAHLASCGDEVAVLAEGVDLTDGKKLTASLVAAAPEVVYHLAAESDVARSWEQPDETVRVNVAGTLSVLEAARSCRAAPRVLLVSSAEVYGGGDGSRPLDEEAPLRPVSPYAVSKVAAEYLGLQAYLGRGLEVLRVRPFNHIGPGQGEGFVIAALGRRIVEAERSGSHEIRVGNLAASRDFTDVRDVVRAYRLLALSGEPGEVYNVCQGQAVTIAALLDELIALSGVELTAVEDARLLRPLDLPVVVGDGTRLVERTGWRPEISRQETLRAVLEYWRGRP